MLKNKNIKKGQLVWWKRIGNSLNQSINCPCVITHVTKDQFKVTSLDDFVESDYITTDSTAYREEMTPTSAKKVITFLNKKSSAIENRIKKAESELQSAFASKAEFTTGKVKIKWSIK